MSGADLVRDIGERRPELPGMILSGHGEASYVERALAAGARGYVLNGDTDDLGEAIRQALQGTTYFRKTMRRRSA